MSLFALQRMHVVTRHAFNAVVCKEYRCRMHTKLRQFCEDMPLDMPYYIGDMNRSVVSPYSQFTLRSRQLHHLTAIIRINICDTHARHGS